VALASRLGDELAERAWLLPLRGRPVEPVLLAWLTDDALGIDADAGAMILLGVFVLGVDVGKTGLNRVELVTPDAAEEYFLATGGGVEPPHVILADEGDWERKILRPDHHDRPVVAFLGDLVLRVIGIQKFLAPRGVGDIIPGRHDIRAVPAE